jgi:hypothetical protein
VTVHLTEAEQRVLYLLKRRQQRWVTYFIHCQQGDEIRTNFLIALWRFKYQLALCSSDQSKPHAYSSLCGRTRASWTLRTANPRVVSNGIRAEIEPHTMRPRNLNHVVRALSSFTSILSALVHPRNASIAAVSWAARLILDLMLV